MDETVERPADKKRDADPRGLCVCCGRWPRDPRFTPFCSRRCADIDLHRWLKGSYVIPGEDSADAEDEPED